MLTPPNGTDFSWPIKKPPLISSSLLILPRIQLQAYKRVNSRVMSSLRMLLLRFLLLSLLAALLLGAAQCKKITCQESCCSFVEGFPVRLRALRSSYNSIRDYYSPYGCSIMSDILHFYLETVLPSAINGHVEKKSLKSPINNIGNVFQELKRELIRCRIYFTCRQPFEISSVKNSYSQMGGRGLYKAMAELDMLFNYIEDYVASHKRKH
ncbi:Interleukin-10 [Bagarius yarrelli]|uniref:Interleukin family protein n=1 Tax=Bagarius yarrelli TaxID=175774 RepID=A0A556V8Z1_BAGYA|nr:Interleukin-10 [Bagarius yarrelli]